MERPTGIGESGRPWGASLLCALLNMPAHNKSAAVSILLILCSFLFRISPYTFSRSRSHKASARKSWSQWAQIENTPPGSFHWGDGGPERADDRPSLQDTESAKLAVIDYKWNEAASGPV